MPGRGPAGQGGRAGQLPPRAGPVLLSEPGGCSPAPESCHYQHTTPAPRSLLHGQHPVHVQACSAGLLLLLSPHFCRLPPCCCRLPLLLLPAPLPSPTLPLLLSFFPPPRSTMFLMGPAKQLSRMFDAKRRWSTLIYITALACTLVSAIVLHSIILSVLFIIVQFSAFVYYALRHAFFLCQRAGCWVHGATCWVLGTACCNLAVPPARWGPTQLAHAFAPAALNPAAATFPAARPLRAASCPGAAARTRAKAPPRLAGQLRPAAMPSAG